MLSMNVFKSGTFPPWCIVNKMCSVIAGALSICALDCKWRRPFRIICIRCEVGAAVI